MHTFFFIYFERLWREIRNRRATDSNRKKHKAECDEKQMDKKFYIEMVSRTKFIIKKENLTIRASLKRVILVIIAYIHVYHLTFFYLFRQYIYLEITYFSNKLFSKKRTLRDHSRFLYWCITMNIWPFAHIFIKICMQTMLKHMKNYMNIDLLQKRNNHTLMPLSFFSFYLFFLN